MAAVNLSRSKVMSGVTTIRGFFIIFTLLVLVNLSSSLIKKDQLEELKENIQKLQQAAVTRKDNLKLDIFYIPLFYDDFMRLLDILSETLNTTSEDYSPMLDLTDDLKTFLKATKKYIDKDLETTAGEIKDYEEKLNVVMERLTHLEKHKDEL